MDVRQFATSFAVLALMVGAPAVAAAVPPTVNYTGSLQKDGNSVDDTVAMEFRLYDQETDGSEVWASQERQVTVRQGQFTVELGQTNQQAFEMAINGSELWLEITVEGNTLSPRKKIGSVPYAKRADRAKSAEQADNASTLEGSSLSEVKNVAASDVSAQFDGSQSDVQSAIDDLESRVETLENKVSSLESTQSSIESNLTDGNGNLIDVASLKSSFDSLQQTVNQDIIPNLQDAGGNYLDVGDAVSDGSGSGTYITVRNYLQGPNGNLLDVANAVSDGSGGAIDLKKRLENSSGNLYDVGTRVYENLRASGNWIDAAEVTQDMTRKSYRGQTSLLIDGINVYVRDGSGSTYGAGNGAGNFILGYNDPGSGSPSRKGSHNLVVGDEHAWDSNGGIISGEANSMFAPKSALLGGLKNKVNSGGAGSAMVAGELNEISAGVTTGTRSAAVAGTFNEVNGNYSLAGGGNNNIAGDDSYTVTVAGKDNEASGAQGAFLSGGSGRSPSAISGAYNQD